MLYLTEHGGVLDVTLTNDAFGGELFMTVALGGGFVQYTTNLPAGRIISKEEYTSKILNLCEGVASIDGEGNYPCHYNNLERWNGYNVPYMSKDVCKRFFLDMEIDAFFCTEEREDGSTGEYLRVWDNDVDPPVTYCPNELGLYPVYARFDCYPHI